MRRGLQTAHPVIGDRLDLKTVTLVVRRVEGDKITTVGLKLLSRP
jgi:cell volume regulation protein A